MQNMQGKNIHVSTEFCNILDVLSFFCDGLDYSNIIIMYIESIVSTIDLFVLCVILLTIYIQHYELLCTCE